MHTGLNQTVIHPGSVFRPEVPDGPAEGIPVAKDGLVLADRFVGHLEGIGRDSPDTEFQILVRMNLRNVKLENLNWY